MEFIKLERGGLLELCKKEKTTPRRRHDKGLFFKNLFFKPTRATKR